MVVTFAPIAEISTSKVLFISARLGKDPQLEFEKFDAKQYVELHHIAELQIIYTSIFEMGKRGAKQHYFRSERAAFALPGRVDQTVIEANPYDFGIRLYCGFLRPDLVLLLNGDIKTKQNPEECPNVAPHFRNADRIVRALLKAEREGYVRFTADGIEIDDEFEIEI